MTPPTVISFYAYKGGVGRTMALAHTALYLANLGHRVVAVDLDLAAPSLWSLLGGEHGDHPVPGVVETMNAWLHGQPLGLHERLRAIPLHPAARGALFVLSAGLMDQRYLESLESLDWSRVVSAPSSDSRLEPLPSAHFFDVLRQALGGTATAVLLDLPTGFDETANLCLRVASDLVVAMLAPNRMQMEGVARVVGALTEEREARRRRGAAPRPDILAVVSTVMSPQPSSRLHRRVANAFDYLARVHHEASGSSAPDPGLVGQPGIVIGYDMALSEVEQIDTRVPIDDLRGPYRDLLECLVAQAPAASDSALASKSESE